MFCNKVHTCAFEKQSLQYIVFSAKSPEVINQEAGHLTEPGHFIKKNPETPSLDFNANIQRDCLLLASPLSQKPMTRFWTDAGTFTPLKI